MIKFLFVIVALTLVSCGGGGGGSSTSSTVTNQQVSGIWRGTSYSSVQKSTSNILGIISENNVARFLSLTSGGQYSGVIAANESSFSSSMTAYAPLGYAWLDGSVIGNMNINGTVAPKTSLNGSYSGVGDSGTFTFAYDSKYERPSSLSSVSGSWSLTSSGVLYNVSVNSNGTITGNTSTGCTYSGVISIINASYNCYNVNLTIGSCGAFNGNYTGLATLTDTYTANDTLIYGISNSSAAIVASFIKH